MIEDEIFSHFLKTTPLKFLLQTYILVKNKLIPFFLWKHKIEHMMP